MYNGFAKSTLLAAAFLNWVALLIEMINIYSQVHSLPRAVQINSDTYLTILFWLLFP